MTTKVPVFSPRTRRDRARCAIGLAWAVLAGFYTNVAVCDMNEVEARFRREYPPAAEQLEKYYGTMSAESDLQQADGRVEHCRFYGNGVSFRIDKHVPAMADISSVFASNHFFIVQKDQGQQDYRITAMEETRVPDGLQRLRRNSPIPFAAYSLMDLRIVDFITEPGFQITNATTIKSNEGQTVSIEWENPYIDETKASQTRVGTFLFDPSRGWILRHFAMNYQKGLPARLCADIHYTSDNQNPPMIEEYERYVKKEGRREPRFLVKVDSVKLGPAPSELFRLSAFGIPDSVGQQSSPTFGIPILIVVNVLLLMTTAVAIWYLRGRNRSRPEGR